MCFMPFVREYRKYVVRCSIATNTVIWAPVNTICTFACKDRYYRHKGDVSRTCQANGDWSGSEIDCQPIKCPKVPINEPETNKVMAESSSFDCFNKELNAGDHCQFKCPYGYYPVGNTLMVCQKDGDKPTGTWNVDFKANPPTCKDYSRPVFAQGSACAKGSVSVIKSTLPGKSYGEVYIEKVQVTDNSGAKPTVISSPSHFESGRTYKFNVTNDGGTYITFTASDKAGNMEVCTYRIIIEDKEPPVITYCPNDIVKNTTQSDAVISWREPTYEDNCGSDKECHITINKPPENNGAKYPVGTRKVVKYIAVDPSRNRNTDCVFTIAVSRLQSTGGE